MGSFQGLGWCPSGKAAEKHHSPGWGPLRVEGIPPAGQEAPAHHAPGSTRPREAEAPLDDALASSGLHTKRLRPHP